MNNIILSKYVIFSKKDGKFKLTKEGKNKILKDGGLIINAKCADEWLHHFVCEMFNLYSGKSPFNNLLNSVNHETMIPEFYIINEKNILSYITPSEDKKWLKKVYDIVDLVIDEAENIQGEL